MGMLKKSSSDEFCTAALCISPTLFSPSPRSQLSDAPQVKQKAGSDAELLGELSTCAHALPGVKVSPTPGKMISDALESFGLAYPILTFTLAHLHGLHEPLKGMIFP